MQPPCNVFSRTVFWPAAVNVQELIAHESNKQPEPREGLQKCKSPPPLRLYHGEKSTSCEKLQTTANIRQTPKHNMTISGKCENKKEFNCS